MTYKNLVIKQGESWSEPVQISNGLGSPLDLTNYTFECTLKKAYTSKAFVEIHVAVVDPSSGNLTLWLSATETAAIKSGRYVYALLLISPDDIETFALDGIITVEASATANSVG